MCHGINWGSLPGFSLHLSHFNYNPRSDSSPMPGDLSHLVNQNKVIVSYIKYEAREKLKLGSSCTNGRAFTASCQGKEE